MLDTSPNRTARVCVQVVSAVANHTSEPLFESYPTNSYLDDLFWASTWLLRATMDDFRTANASYYYTAARTTFELAFAERDSMAVSPDYMNNVALIHAASITKDWSFHAAAQSWIWDWICSGDVKYTTFGRGYHPESMFLGDTVLAAAAAATYVHSVREWDKANVNREFMTGALSNFPTFVSNWYQRLQASACSDGTFMQAGADFGGAADAHVDTCSEVFPIRLTSSQRPNS